MSDQPNQMSREDSQRLRALFEMATDGIITMNERGVIENVNRAACELFEYSAEELWGQKVNLLMGEHDRKHHDEYLARYQRTGEAHIIGVGREVTGRRKDGTTFPLRLAVSEVQVGDQIIYTGILHDLTEFNQAKQRVEELNSDLENKVANRTAALIAREQELQRALGKERELNELKSRFLSMASHEFKTPLSTVLSSVELIEMYERTDQQDRRSKHINRIKDAIGQLTEVLDDFLSLSKLEQGDIAPHPRLVDLPAVVATSVETSEGQLKTGQYVTLDLADEPRRIVTDPKLLRHVLINLLSNAAKYSPAGTKILLQTEMHDGHLLIKIRDHGIGIPTEDRKHLFDRFFRARNVENIKGTGLGLNIVDHYARLLGGRVTFSEPETGPGSIFTVRLPLRTENQS